MTESNKKLVIAYLLIALGLTARLLPHPANFAPIGAIALFGGLYLPRKYALIVPLGALFVSDVFIGLYSPKMMLAVYAGFAVMGLLGMAAKKRKSFSTIVGATLLGSIAFYLITNAAVWGFGTMYAKTLSGLMQSYTMALPFFRNSLLGDFFFTGILVGSMEAIQHYYSQKSVLEKRA